MIQIIHADVIDGLQQIPDQTVQCVVTSPPYWGLRDYGVEGQIGLEKSPEEYVNKMVEVFREVKRVLRDDGTVWLNLGDCYNGSGKAGSTPEYQSHHTEFGKPSVHKERFGNPTDVESLKPKDLIGMPWRVAFALQADGWYLRSDIIWSKPNPMPESVTDRCTKSHEYIFLLTKKPRYYYDADAVREKGTIPAGTHAAFTSEMASGNGIKYDRPDGWVYTGNRNRRTVWEIATQPFTANLQTDLWVRAESDAVFDGMMHIVSPDCPVHGGLIDLLSNVVCDGHAISLLSHIERNDTRRVQELLSGYVPSDSLLLQNYGLDNLGSLLRICVLTAISHNNQNRRKARVPLTNPSYTLYEEMISRTDGIQELREFFERQKNILLNNTLPDEMGAHSLDQIPFRNTGILSFNAHNNCLCSFYKKVAKKIDHFATFPEALVEPCIKAGTSERGCCSVCGAPWVRVVEKTPDGRPRLDTEPWNAGGPSSPHKGYRGSPIITEIGWQPSCSCCEYKNKSGGCWAIKAPCDPTNSGCEKRPAEAVPCIVLDPFGGSGTVAKVARDLNRKAILIELNAEYIKIARERLRLNEQLGAFA